MAPQRLLGPLQVPPCGHDRPRFEHQPRVGMRQCEDAWSVLPLARVARLSTPGERTGHPTRGTEVEVLDARKTRPTPGGSETRLVTVSSKAAAGKRSLSSRPSSLFGSVHSAYDSNRALILDFLEIGRVLGHSRNFNSDKSRWFICQVRLSPLPGARRQTLPYRKPIESTFSNAQGRSYQRERFSLFPQQSGRISPSVGRRRHNQ
jgi:hypothetical protein